MDILDGIHLEHDVAHALPCTTVGALLESIKFTGVAVEPGGVVLNEIDDSLVETLTDSPVEPFLDGGLELEDVEAAHEGWVEVGELVFLAIVYGRYEVAALWQRLACQLTIQGEVHHRLQNLRTGTVQLVEEEHDRLVVLRKPIRWCEVGERGGFSIGIHLLHL